MELDTNSELGLARRLCQENRLAFAEETLGKVLAREPENGQALTILGMVYARSSRMPAAQNLLETVLLRDPNQVEAICCLAIIRRAQNDFPSAIELFQRAIHLGQGTPETYNHLGVAWLGLPNASAAVDAFYKAIELNPASVQANFNLGMAQKQLGRNLEAFLAFKRTIELNPLFEPAYVQMHQQMHLLLNWRDGLPVLEAGFARMATSSVLAVQLAITYGKLGMTERAEELFQRACSLDPHALPAFANWLQEQGRFPDSIEILKESVRGFPVQGRAYFSLVEARVYDLDGVSLRKLMLPLLAQNQTLVPEEQMFLSYALAKISDREKNYGEAMEFYDRANSLAFGLYNSRVNFDRATAEAGLSSLEQLYTRELISRLGGHGSQSQAPILIVGMVRSGTTLLEQILSAHPEIQSAGEQPFWHFNGPETDRKWMRTGGEAADIRELERGYLKALYDEVGESPRIIDKMPLNYRHLGQIGVVFPRAKFIHLRRSPLDTALSIYTTYLGSETPFAYKQENIVSVYRDYMRIMEHWRSVIRSDQMLEIDYEELVGNRAPILREILEFCGLAWDEACLRHEEGNARVSTPSVWTARQPINTASVGRWRNYEAWLGQLAQLRNLSHPKAANGGLHG
jgi:tetratricopeptide (TPR) repeat protein